MTPDLRGRFLRADVVQAVAPGRVEATVDAVIEIDAEGAIAAVHAPGSAGHGAALRSGRVEAAPGGAALLPGLVDLHVHAPQHPQLGIALDRPLEEWLTHYTFPLEARYGDLAFADRAYRACVAELLGVGTTTAVYFATIHDAATLRLAEICRELGQRALIGRVAMDDPDLCPEDYRDPSAEAALAGTRAVIDGIRAMGCDRVRPMVCPRFVPSCTDALLEGLGRLAAETGTAVTSHVSESDWEHAFVAERHGRSDAEVLDGFGLMRPGSVMAHGCFLSGGDMALMRERGTGVAHCPASNAYFAGAVFPLRRALEAGLGVGLGTDVSGGPSASLWETARTAILASRMLAAGVDPDRPAGARGGRQGAAIDAATAFWLATLGGAEVLGLPVGLLAAGRRFDAVLVAEAPGAPGKGDPPEARLARLLHRTTRADILDVWVDGLRVAGG